MPENDPGTVGSGVNSQVKLKLGEVRDDDPHIRCGVRGYGRMDFSATRHFSVTAEQRGFGSFPSWAAVIEDLETGTYYLVPTVEADSDKLRLRWIDGNHAIIFSLRKLFKLKGFKVPKGHAWTIPCRLGKLADGKPGLELRFKDGYMEPTANLAVPPAEAAGEAAAGKE